MTLSAGLTGAMAGVGPVLQLVAVLWRPGAGGVKGRAVRGEFGGGRGDGRGVGAATSPQAGSGTIGDGAWAHSKKPANCPARRGFAQARLDFAHRWGISRLKRTATVLIGNVLIRLSRIADYGIVLMTELARGQRSMATPELAERTRIAQPMAGKILKALTREGLLVSHRGAKGGYQLARQPSLVTVAEIIEALDGPIALTACIEAGAGECGIEEICPARSNWHRINAAMRDALDGISLDEMTHGWRLGQGGLLLEHSARIAAAGSELGD